MPSVAPVPLDEVAACIPYPSVPAVNCVVVERIIGVPDTPEAYRPAATPLPAPFTKSEQPAAELQDIVAVTFGEDVFTEAMFNVPKEDVALLFWQEIVVATVADTVVVSASTLAVEFIMITAHSVTRDAAKKLFLLCMDIT
jgi:hypothetical protein